MKKITTATLLAACGGLLFGACEVKQAPAEPQIEEVFEAFCDMTFTCCEEVEAGYFVGPYVLPSECTSRMMEFASVSPVTAIDLTLVAGLRMGDLLIPNLPALNEAVQDGRTVISREGLDECKEYLGSGDCNEYVEPEPLEGCQPAVPAPPPGPCDPSNLFIGQLIEGQDCTSGGFSFECKPGYRCGTGAGLGVNGRCVRLRQVTETCVADTDCESGLYCSKLDGTCKAFSDVGETCAYADRNDPAPSADTLLVRCASHLACNPLSELCVEACQEGALCAYDTDCDDGLGLTCILGRCSQPRQLDQPCAMTENCDEGLRCATNPQAPAELSCQPTLPLNAPCTEGTDCESGYCPATSTTPGTALICTEPVDIGEPCPMATSDQCGDGACVRESPSTACTLPADCPNSGECMVDGYCGYYCIEKKDDGATCDVDTECTSETCIAGFCRTIPLDLGVACEDAAECESLFCNYETERECDNLPLDLNDPCLFGGECDSGVCFENECTNGLDEGDGCGDAGDPPCNPFETYCDFELETPICVILRETGEECDSPLQCRGDCVLAQSRMLCSPAAKKEAAVCDGGGAGIGAGGAGG